MPNLQELDHYRQFVQDKLVPGKYMSAQFMVMAAGPPSIKAMGKGGATALGKGQVVFPIGVTQNWALAQNMGLARIFEIGSQRSFFIPSHTVQQLSLSHVWYHGASLLRLIYAYYKSSLGSSFKAMFDHSFEVPHSVRLTPGYENYFINLASDLFKQPIGMLLLARDSNEDNIGAIYAEQCYVPSHTIAADAQGVLVQEQAGIQFERLVPVKLGNAVSLIRGFQAEDIAALTSTSNLP